MQDDSKSMIIPNTYNSKFTILQLTAVMYGSCSARPMKSDKYRGENLNVLKAKTNANNNALSELLSIAIIAIVAIK